MGACPFCDLASGLVDAELIALRTPNAVVVPVPMQRPSNQGHVLIIPTQHLTRLADVEGSFLQELFHLAGRVSIAAKAVFAATGSTIFLNDNTPDQALLHLHIHVVPRRPGDEFKVPDPNKVALSHDVRREQALALRRALDTVPD